MTPNLWASNSPQRFWLCQPDPPPDIWGEAIRKAIRLLGFPEEVKHIDDVLERTLGEAQFGKNRYTIGPTVRLYYGVKPVLPRSLTCQIRRVYSRAKIDTFPLSWPIEPRFQEFHWEILRQVLLLTHQSGIAFKYFWPAGKRFAFVLTHDIETARGQSLVPVLADMEEALGLRSMFNFVPELYPLDRGLMRDLQNRGFEIGVHGLKHDSKLYDTYARFAQRAERINCHLRDFQAHGFRSPLTLRNPEWMQDLDMEYDLSFFDTDPFEPMPGGVMSIWPFTVGRFIELPYTLPQDSTLFNILRDLSPRIWLEKLEWLKKYHGMALLLVHPDYSGEGVPRQIYKDFLNRVIESAECWYALPREVASWWKERMAAKPMDVARPVSMAHARLNGDALDIVCS